MLNTNMATMEVLGETPFYFTPIDADKTNSQSTVFNANLADKQRVITKASIKSTQVMVDGRRQVNNS